MTRERIDSCLDEISGNEFEHLVADIWEESGYEAEITQDSRDRGVDVIAKQDIPVEDTTLIQAKRYSKGNKISSDQIQQYSALKHQNENADRVIVVTTSSFTVDAEDLANELDVDLIDRDDLISLIEKYDLDMTLKSASYFSKTQTKSRSKTDESVIDTEDELLGTCSACASSNVITANCSVCGKEVCADCRKASQHTCRDIPKNTQDDPVENETDIDINKKDDLGSETT